MFSLKKKTASDDAAAVSENAPSAAAAVSTVGNRRSDVGSGPPTPLLTIKPSKKTCIVLAALMGGTLAGSGGLFVWQNGLIAQTEKLVADKQAEVADGEKVTKRLQVVETTYADTQKQIQYLETSVTASEYVPTMLKQMEDLAKQVNLKVSAVRPTMEPAPKPPADKEARKTFKTWPYDKIHVDMDVSGSYWNVARMLFQLTEFPKIMSVEAVQVTPEIRPDAQVLAGSSPNLNVKLKLTGFIFPTDGVPHALPPGLPSAKPSGIVPPPLSAPSAAAAPSPSPAPVSAAAPTTAAVVASPGLVKPR